MKNKTDLEDMQPGVPLFGTWPNAYLVVAAIFVLEVGFFYFISQHFL